VLVIHEGAMFEGNCSMQPDAAHDGKVAVFPKEERHAQSAAHKPA
jgi:cytoskeletal protein CcmA (bactofilin family)